MDGKHIRIKCPNKSGSYYYNYKGFFSIILFAVVDPEYNFTYLCIGGNGRAGDAAIWDECALKQALENNALNLAPHHVLVADDAFPLKPYIMKPYSKKKCTEAERIFNYRLSRARRISENAFGILSWRFRIFQRPIELKVDTIDKVIWAACSLHNWIKHKHPTDTCTLADAEDLNSGDIIHGRWREVPYRFPSISRVYPGNHYAQDGEQVRKKYAEYFVNAGSVPWQWKRAGCISTNNNDEETDEDD